MKATRIGLTLGLMTLAAVALALPTMLTTFKDHYKVVKGSALDKAGCVTCHVTKTGGKNLNPYGQDLKKVLDAAKTKKLTPDLLKKVENLDSDKDGVKNAAEIKAGTLPGDPKSHPPKK